MDELSHFNANENESDNSCKSDDDILTPSTRLMMIVKKTKTQIHGLILKNFSHLSSNKTTIYILNVSCVHQAKRHYQHLEHLIRTSGST
jgi:uncharacterized membrane protein